MKAFSGLWVSSFWDTLSTDAVGSRSKIDFTTQNSKETELSQAEVMSSVEPDAKKA
ncbi:hypothetical protein NFHSH190041_32050 [Shewanella sp. NFH-SH190041]|uniref:hypothetical protein n=1 Tax=Shewanella sp. NFH-SH190041 TaxID=2950245 RepID=UPI0021C2A59F|nr:hypothetical protein [Shewanella sp. NFH-SH190041]BDM65753.1 hypothetical protein NFHSH190041_32050 [Shewanella sp. NFH-SH190041]